MKKYSLQTKLSLSYVGLALLLVAVLSFSTNFLLERQFRDYIIKQQEQKNQDLVSLISQQYQAHSRSWDTSVVEYIGVNALEQGLIIRLKDAANQIVWDATVHNSGLCLQMLDHMSRNMSSRYPNFQGGYVENIYPIKQAGVQIGSMEIGYYGPFYLNDNDLAFINTLNMMLLGSGGVSLLAALLLGAYMSKRLSIPILGVINTAQKIAKGHLDSRIEEESSTREIEQLTMTINDLADTLSRQEKLRKRLTADIAHELRTPLATLQSHLEAMIDGVWPVESNRLKSCYDELMRISRMVGDLEKLAQVEGQNLILHKTTFSLLDLVSSIVLVFASEFQNKGVVINVQEEDIMLEADRDKISQVIVNLLANALKYTPRGGTVTITLMDSPGLAGFSVRDTGAGIAPADLPHVFERFYRADKSRHRQTGGSGIGLSIVKAIVQAHQGEVTVSSTINQGTEFVVTLPKQAG